MAFYDWNHDGKKNLLDDYIEYKIYKKSMDNKDNCDRDNCRKASSNFSFTGSLVVFLVCCVIACFNELVAAIIFGIYLFIKVMT